MDEEVHWYLMMADSYYSKPQREEYFVDSGLRIVRPQGYYSSSQFANEKAGISEKAYHEYLEISKKKNLWGSSKSISEVSGSRRGILHKKGGKAEWTLFHAAFSINLFPIV